MKKSGSALRITLITDKMNLGNLVWVFLQGQVEGNNDNTNKKELEDNNLL